MSEEQTKDTVSEGKKSHVFATLSIDDDGVYHASYVGYYTDPRTKKARFGNWVESSMNMNKLLKILLPRFQLGRKVYLETIHSNKKEAENATEHTQLDSSAQQPTEQQSDIA